MSRPKLPKQRQGSKPCDCGCGYLTSTPKTSYILGHRPKPDPSPRFWAKVKRGAADECWLWTAHLHDNGYALFTPVHGEPRIMAHRFAYELLVGPIPEGLTIDHLCRNRACCNPGHMEPVTRGENARRGKGWVVSAERRHGAGECSNGHPRTSEHARIDKNGWWECRTCRNERRQRKRAA